MPLLPPGHSSAMQEDSTTPDIPTGNRSRVVEEVAKPPSPPPVSSAIHQPEEDDEPATMNMVSRHQEVDEAPPPPPQQGRMERPHTPPEPVSDTPPRQEHMPQERQEHMPQERPEHMPQTRQEEPAQPPVPTDPPVRSAVEQNSSGILKTLEDEGFEGLDIGFGSFPIVRLQDQNFSTNEGLSLGSRFFCVMHSSRTKWLLKAEDSSQTDDFVYSYDKVYTTAGRECSAVIEEWAEKGMTSPIWKKYLDVTAQMLDMDTGELGNVVILSIPNNSVPRLSGYISTVRIGRKLPIDSVVTEVYPGQRVTAAKKPFYPWAFRLHSVLN